MIVTILTVSNIFAQVVQKEVPELQGIDVVEHLGDYVPFDLIFTDDAGKTVRLGDYFNQAKPVLLILGYYECPMLCKLVFNGVSDGVRELSWQPGKDFQMLTVSINPLETHELAAAKKKNYVEALGRAGARDGWAFLVGDESQSRALADAVGFEYYYDESRDLYAHPAVIFLLAEDGKITRYLYGIQFPEKDLRLGLLEASEGKIGSTMDRIILYCFHYDPDARGYVLFAGNVMRLGGVVTLIALALLLGLLWMRERRRKSHRETAYAHRSSAEN
jgi:protein SCO1/2